LRLSPIPIEALLGSGNPAATVSAVVTLGIKDALGNTILSTDAAVPIGFKGETTTVGIFNTSSRFEASTLISGYLDCDTIAATLVDPSWSINVSWVFTGTCTLLSFQGWEVPRFIADDTVTGGGVIPGSFQSDAPITDSTQTGLERLLATVESARISQHTLFNYSWPRSIVATEAPQLTGVAYVPFDLLTDDVAVSPFVVGTPFYERIRQVYVAAAAGEVTRVRYLYRMSAGAAETAKIRMYSGATGSPWSTGNLAYTVTWTWSDWVAGAASTASSTDYLAFDGKLSGAGAILHLGAIHCMTATA